MVSELSERVRDHVNDTAPVHAHLIKNAKRWLRVVAALDVADDTEMGIRSYYDGRDRAVSYLECYGLLQCMYVQQDALQAVLECHLDLTLAGFRCEAFSWNDFPDWRYVRRVRNECAGHPSETNNPATVHGIIRLSLERDSFEYVSEPLGGEARSTLVNLRSLRAQQAAGSERILRRVLDHSESVYAAYRSRLRSAIPELRGLWSDELVAEIRAKRLTPSRVDIIPLLNRLEQLVERTKVILRRAGGGVSGYVGVRDALEDLVANIRAIRRDAEESQETSALLGHVLADARILRDCMRGLEQEASA
jgi:hypothetical protein